MAGDPHPFLRDGEQVDKSEGRAFVVLGIADANALAALDMGEAQYLVIGERLYKKSPSLAASPASGLDILIDANGNRWRALDGRTYLLPFFTTLGLGASELLLIHQVATNLTLPEDFLGSEGYAMTTATAETVLTVKKNDTDTIGTITFHAGLHEPTFAAAAEVVLVAGDFITVRAPSSQDATLANIAVTLMATR